MARKTKEPIKLRRRAMSSGNISLYLDIYINGRRSYEYLKLYLVPETNRAAKEANRQTLLLAEAVRAKRVVELQEGKFGFANTSKRNTLFIDYYDRICAQHRSANGGLHTNWDSVRTYLAQYCRAKLTFNDVTTEWVRGFRDFLTSTTLAPNTRAEYFNKLRACINKAMTDHLLTSNPLVGVEGIRGEEKERVYLTLDEVKAMAMTPCRRPKLKRAFLFSCLTGLRKSDIEKMRWMEVRQEGEFTRIVFRQKKTGGQEYLDISPEAVPYLGERARDDDFVFNGFHYTSYMVKALREWAQRAGVNKPLTFHSARHTFAVMMLELGADIYTVQKLLGHRLITTTQIYAHIRDKKKQEAVALIPHLPFQKRLD